MRGGFFIRIVLFAATNIAVLAVLAVVLQVIGLESYLAAQGVGINLPALLVFAAAFGFGGSFVSLLMSKWIARLTTGAKVINAPRNDQEAWLLTTVQDLSRGAGIASPEVAIYPSDDLNAFATGWSRNHALVAVSHGLLRSMRRDQAEAVLAHEVSHVANGDMITLALVQGVLNTFVIFASRLVGYVVDRAFFRSERGHGPAFWVTTIAAQILLGILATIIVLWFSRRREFRADAGAAQLRGAQPMIGALETLRLAHAPAALPDSFKAFGIRGKTSSGLRRLFASHPPLEERIAALRSGA